MEKEVKWFENIKEAREHFVSDTRSHGIVFEPKEVKSEEKEPVADKKKAKKGSKKVEQDE